MLFDKGELMEMSRDQLIHLVVENGLQLESPQASKKELVDKLLLHSATEPQPETPEMPHTAAKPASQVGCTLEEVKEACAGFILRGMKMYVNKEENTWLFQVKVKPMRVRDTNTGETRVVERMRDDSGTFNQPLSTIVRCARVLMSGAPSVQELTPTANPADKMEAVA